MKSNIPAEKDVPSIMLYYGSHLMAAHFMAMVCVGVGARAGAIQAQYKVISGPPGRSSNTTFGFFIATLTLVILEQFQQQLKTRELWSTYEKWRFQLFAGHNPRTNSESVIQCYPGLKPENRVIISYYLQCVLLKKINITVLSSNVCILFAFVRRNCISDILVV